MERRQLGTTDLELSVVGLGTWVFGGRWGGAEDADSVAACHAAIDAGINWIDTADLRAGARRADCRHGRTRAARRGHRCHQGWRRVAGRQRRPDDLAGGVGRLSARAFDRSLLALGLDYVDLYQVHWPVAGVDPADTFGPLIELRQAGKIRHIGVSNYSVADFEAAARSRRSPATSRGIT